MFLFLRLKHKHENRNDRPASQTESDSHLESLMLEADLRGSNMSLNSSSSSVSSKSQEPTSMWVHLYDEANGYLTLIVNFVFTFNVRFAFSNDCMPTLDSGTPSARSPISRRTSPVSVPISSRLRQRQESSSSLSVGSWQVITATGSLRGSDSNSDSNGLNGNSTRY